MSFADETQIQFFDDHYGFAPLRAAQNALDVHNAAAGWNKALLDNAARPSGALIYTNQQGLTDEQYDRLKAELDENFSGARNAGRPLLLDGGLDWKPLSLSPKDMDFIEAKSSAAREIALAFGVPPLLLGLPGDNTRANYEEANRAFWRQTVIPRFLFQKIWRACRRASPPGCNRRLAILPSTTTSTASTRSRVNARRNGRGSAMRRSSPTTKNARPSAMAACRAARKSSTRLISMSATRNWAMGVEMAATAETGGMAKPAARACGERGWRAVDDGGRGKR